MRVVDERAMNDSANENFGDLSNTGEQSLANEEVGAFPCVGTCFSGVSL